MFGGGGAGGEILEVAAQRVVGHGSGVSWTQRRWPVVRALILGVVIVLSLVKSIPVVVVTPETIPHHRMTRWLATFMPTEDVVAFTEGTAETQRVLLLPVDWFYQRLHTIQRWNMFSGAAFVTYRMQVEVRGPDTRDWEVVYREFDDDARFEADRVEYRRVRAAYSTFAGEHPAPYGSFVRWIAGRVFAERDDVQEVRVRMRRIDRRPPERRTGQQWRWGHGIRITRRQYDDDQAALRRIQSEIAQ